MSGYKAAHITYISLWAQFGHFCAGCSRHLHSSFLLFSLPLPCLLFSLLPRPQLAHNYSVTTHLYLWASPVSAELNYRRK
ncbi:hypothetical protein FKM82_016496 [Ascaphus truei]